MEMTWLSIEAAVRSPGRLRCFSSRIFFHEENKLERTIWVGPGAMG